MEFYFIRHAQSTNNALWDATRSSSSREEDPELTEIGLEQARLLARFLKTGNPLGGSPTSEVQIGFGLTHLYCSLMSRSAATGWIAAQALGLPLEALQDVHEEGGIYLDDESSGQRVGRPGKNRAYYESTYPGIRLPEALGEDGWWNNRPFEEEQARMVRARRFVAALLEKHGSRPDRVAVISHGGFYNRVLAAIIGLDPERRVWGVIHNTGITRIDFERGYTDILYMNRTDFLPAHLLT